MSYGFSTGGVRVVYCDRCLALASFGPTYGSAEERLLSDGGVSSQTAKGRRHTCGECIRRVCGAEQGAAVGEPPTQAG